MNRFLPLALLLPLATPVRAETFIIDPDHSGVSFRIRHLVGKVRGRFSKFSGSFVYDAKDPKTWKASAEVDAASIDTGVSKRDAHLRTADFFDVGRCSKLAFKSSRVAALKDGRGKLSGDLTIRCVTLPVTFDLEFGGTAKDLQGNLRAGAVVTGRINRADFGVAWNKTFEAGKLILGNEVEIFLEIEGIAAKR